MRREGYEMILTPPQILTTTCPDTGCQLEPWEEVIVDVDAEHSGTVVNALTGARRGVLAEMSDDSQGKTRLSFEAASRGLLGFGPEIATATRGTAIMHHCYLEDREHAGTVGRAGSDQGRLVSNATGKATLFALGSLSSRGTSAPSRDAGRRTGRARCVRAEKWATAQCTRCTIGAHACARCRTWVGHGGGVAHGDATEWHGHSCRCL